MGTRLSGIGVDVTIGDHQVQFEQVTISIEDNSKAVTTKGRPNGHVNGKVTSSGEVTVDTANLNVMLDVARAAGSWKQMPPFDIVMNSETDEDKLNVEAFECLIKIADLLDAEGDGEEKLNHKLPFEVTGKDFVRINGVPYLPEADKERLT